MADGGGKNDESERDFAQIEKGNQGSFIAELHLIRWEGENPYLEERKKSELT